MALADFTNDLHGDITSFAAMVRSANIIIQDVTNEEVRTISNNQAYPRIGLILLAAKDLENNPLFKGDTAIERFAVVKKEMNHNSSSSLFGQGIRRVAAFLCASILVRNIPLSSSIKQVEVGDMMEKQALEDLDRIIKLYQIDSSSKSNPNDATITIDHSIYISLGIDKITIPESTFDIADFNSNPPSFTEAVPVQNVKTFSTTPEYTIGKTGYCWIYCTGNETSGLLSKNYIESIVEIKSGWATSSVILAISDEINRKSLDYYKNVNILVSPNKNKGLSSATINQKKGYFYPTTSTNYYRQASFDLSYEVDSLCFDSRRYNNEVQRELITICFYTCDIEVLNQYNQKLINESELIKNSTNGIDGLLISTNNEYSLMTEEGPCSIIITCDKTTAKVESIDNRSDKVQIDTFHFKLENEKLDLGEVGLDNNFTYRISSTPQLFSPVEFSFDVLDFDNPIKTAEDLALKLLEGLYSFTKDSQIILGEASFIYRNNVLGVLSKSNAVQITAFAPLEKNFRAVVDILKVPKNLLISTGTSLQPQSLFKSYPRSIVIDAIEETNMNQTEAEIIDSVKASATAVKGYKSPRLQAVYDKLDFLKRR